MPLIVAWGALAFGAVYPWSYGPLCVACAVSGVVALTVPRVRASLPRTLVIAVAALIGAALLQQVPLPRHLLQQISPAAGAILTRYDLAFGFEPAAGHALSIDPSRTWAGILLLTCLAVFWLGLIGLLDEPLTARLTKAIVAIGLGVALIAIAFSSDRSGNVYGIWQPRSSATPFGPFVNRNHYAGWMLMSTLLAFGYFGGLLSNALSRARSWRERLIWLSSPQGSRLILAGAAVAAMTISVLLSMSRSGIVCLTLGMAAIVFTQARTTLAARARTVFVSMLVASGIALVAWAGPETLITRFSTWRDDSLHGRLAVWRDARRLAGDFPLAGTGLNTFGVAMLFYQSTHLQEHYAEAHNDYLQVAAEGGLLLGLPAMALIVITSGEARRRLRETPAGSQTRWIRAGAAIALLAIAVQEAGEFSLQMPGNAALFCVLAAIALHRPKWDGAEAS